MLGCLAHSGCAEVQTDRTLIIASIGDFGDGSVDSGNVAELVHSWSPDVIITAGDNRYGASTFDDVVGRYYCAYLTDAGTGPHCAGGSSRINKFFPSTGNHDYLDGGGIGEYEAYFTLPGAGIAGSDSSGSELFYDFVVGPVHFFAIDSFGVLINRSSFIRQKAWLKEQLAASASRFQLVYMHHPPYSSSIWHGSTRALQWDYSGWGADAVIAGHDHHYERLELEGIPYFVNGLGGRSKREIVGILEGSGVRYDDGYGAMRITADDETMRFEFFNVAGERVDVFTIGR